MLHHADVADALAVLRAEEVPQPVVLGALAAHQLTDGRLQRVVPEGGAVEMRPQVLLAEGGHAHQARLDGGRLQAVVASHLAGRAGGGGPGGRRPVVGELGTGLLGLQELLHHRTQHRVLVQLWPRLEAGAALRAQVRRVLDGPRLVQARPAEVVAAGRGDRLLEGLQADGARQLLGQGAQLRHGAPGGTRRDALEPLPLLLHYRPEATKETKLRGARGGPRPFREVTWGGRGARGVGRAARGPRG